MSGTGFFEAPEQQSIIKTKLVAKYFGAWATIMLTKSREPSGRIAYIDLFSGPGRFNDGKPSTPLWLLSHALKDGELAKRLVTVFNDKNADYAVQLRAAIDNLSGIEKLAHRPLVMNTAVGSDLVKVLGNTSLVPTLFFIDPWGYKGLSLDLIGSAIRNWGSDCIFFFNYNRINPGINNPSVVHCMNDLFGVERANQLRTSLTGLSPEVRQATIINALAEALREVGGRYVLPFEFKSGHAERTSHYIIFVSKDFRGYHIMKDVMFGLSSDDGDVRNFQFMPVKAPQLQLLFDLAKPHSISALKQLLVRECAGETLTVWDVYEKHSVDTPYIFRNFQDAMLELEAEEALDVHGSSRGRIRNGVRTLGKDRQVTFKT